jgi:hypothetical protein
MPAMKHVDQSLSAIVPTQQAGKRQVHSAESTAPGSAGGGRDHVDAINQVFAELALAYHNQFHKAYAQDGALALAKKYWLGVLGEFEPELILRAVRQVVRRSEYLPTLAAIVQACENAYDLFGLPAPQAAYIEACCAAEPKSQQRWSHPAVYLAGEHTGWFALASETQAQIFPLFEYNYRQLCHRVMTGEQLQLPIQRALPETVAAPLSPEENLQRLAALRQRFDL